MSHQPTDVAVSLTRLADFATLDLARGLLFDLVVLLNHLALHHVVTNFPNELPKDKRENAGLGSPFLGFVILCFRGNWPMRACTVSKRRVRDILRTLRARAAHKAFIVFPSPPQCLRLLFLPPFSLLQLSWCLPVMAC
jgi:hypothetical protein